MSSDLKDKKKGIGLRFAISGIFYVMKSERNFRIHLVFTFLVLLFGLYFGLSKMEWLFVFIAIGFVLVAEMFNSVIEVLVDHFFSEYHPIAGRVKDISAGGVLLAAFTASIIGLFIFLPKLYDFILRTF
jgi:undecaprenol kinase